MGPARRLHIVEVYTSRLIHSKPVLEVERQDEVKHQIEVSSKLTSRIPLTLATHVSDTRLDALQRILEQWK